MNSADLERLRGAGISPEDAERQWAFLRQGPTPPRLLRPCTRGDGIDPLPENPEAVAELVRLFQQACREGRVLHFIPASGAATRMGLAGLPKALVPFHRYGDRHATPVEEHLREISALAGPGGMARAHFTLAPEHETQFLRHLEEVLSHLRAEGIQVEVTHSFQDPATQTVALGEDGQPFRDTSGALLLRPGGHGALLRNLQACGGEFAWIRNIDNIAVASRRARGRHLRQAMAGHLIQLARKPRSRPLRVCGMVANTGEPGGGPFWVQGEGRAELRIVESSEVDSTDADQVRLFRSGTHFNPADLVCALWDSENKPFRLADFSDPKACFVARKTHEGRPLRALEWPGLWNGAMARWDTACIEIPLSEFAPVKTREDLERPEHQEP